MTSSAVTHTTWGRVSTLKHTLRVLMEQHQNFSRFNWRPHKNKNRKWRAFSCCSLFDCQDDITCFQDWHNKKVWMYPGKRSEMFILSARTKRSRTVGARCCCVNRKWVDSLCHFLSVCLVPFRLFFGGLFSFALAFGGLEQGNEGVELRLWWVGFNRAGAGLTRTECRLGCRVSTSVEGKFSGNFWNMKERNVNIIKTFLKWWPEKNSSELKRVLDLNFW